MLSELYSPAPSEHNNVHRRAGCALLGGGCAWCDWVANFGKRADPSCVVLMPMISWGIGVDIDADVDALTMMSSPATRCDRSPVPGALAIAANEHAPKSLTRSISVRSLEHPSDGRPAAAVC
jgi:hypothetical protein